MSEKDNFPVIFFFLICNLLPFYDIFEPSGCFVKGRSDIKRTASGNLRPNSNIISQFHSLRWKYFSPAADCWKLGFRSPITTERVWQRFYREQDLLNRTLQNGFGKWSLFVLSANGWKNQNMEIYFSLQRKPLYGEGFVRLANVSQYDVKAKYRLISRNFSGMKFFHRSVRWTNQKPRAFVSVR